MQRFWMEFVFGLQSREAREVRLNSVAAIHPLAKPDLLSTFVCLMDGAC
jgi:hypothetical protein